MRRRWQRGAWRLVALAGGTVFFLEGCDPTTRATVENGIITSSSSLLGAILQAVIQLQQEKTTATTTARAPIDLAGHIFA